MAEQVHFSRVPPHSLEAEESVIGGMLIDNEAFDRIGSMVAAADFYVERHARVYGAMASMAEQGMPLDVVTVAERLRQRGELEKVGGAAYLAELSERVPTAANIEHYARITREKGVLRRLIRASTLIAEEAYQDSVDTTEFVDQAEQSIFEIADASARTAPERIDSLIAASVSRIDMLIKREDAVTGVPSGFRDLDKLTAGFQPADLIIVAGRPSMGKTAFCLNVASWTAQKAEAGVVIFSLEMSKDQLVTRLLCAQAELNLADVRVGRLNDRDYRNLALAAGSLGTAPIYVDDTPGLTVMELRAKARRLKRDADAGLGLVIVDYLQLMHGTGQDSREQEISAISRALKALAKELDLPVIALSQLNRQAELRHDKRPLMADLRESGALEQDSDVIVFIYRDEVYNPDTPDQGMAELIIGKQRNGPIGTVRLMFDKQFARFRNLSARDEPDRGYYDDEERG